MPSVFDAYNALSCSACLAPCLARTKRTVHTAKEIKSSPPPDYGSGRHQLQSVHRYSTDTPTRRSEAAGTGTAPCTPLGTPRGATLTYLRRRALTLTPRPDASRRRTANPNQQPRPERHAGPNRTG